MSVLPSMTSIRKKHIVSDIREMTPSQARERLKCWRALMRFALEKGWIEEDAVPTDRIPLPKLASKSHEAWTGEDCLRFRQHWPHGTKERLAFELLYWTGCRRVDVVAMGPANIKAQTIRWRQIKIGGTVQLPISGELREALSFAPKSQFTFLETQTGKSRSAKSFGEWCREGPATRLASARERTAFAMHWDVILRKAERATRISQRRWAMRTHLKPPPTRNLLNRIVLPNLRSKGLRKLDYGTGGSVKMERQK